MDNELTDSMNEPKTWGTFWDIFGKRLVELLDVFEGAKVLDVGSGGGSVLYPLAKRVGLSGYVTGVELCDHCAKKTASEIKRCKITNAESIYLDARDTKLPDECFDYITAGFIGWDNYFDFKKNVYKVHDSLMEEITRLLKPEGKFGMSTWLLQEDLDWMYEFLTSQSIKSKKNYHIENEKGWRKILTEWGYIDILVVSDTATYEYDSVDFWWKEMTDYDWVVDEENDTVESLKALAYEKIKQMIVQEKIPFTRDALFVIRKKSERREELVNLH